MKNDRLISYLFLRFIAVHTFTSRICLEKLYGIQHLNNKTIYFFFHNGVCAMCLCNKVMTLEIIFFLHLIVFPLNMELLFCIYCNWCKFSSLLTFTLLFYDFPSIFVFFFFSFFIVNERILHSALIDLIGW